MNHSLTKVATVTLCSILLASPAYSEYCAPQPPPKGLVKRCHSLTLTTIPDNISVLRIWLMKWMEGCAIKTRAAQLVSDESVEEVWSLLEPYRGNMLIGSPTIIPTYTPLKFTQKGRTCYGIASVKFHIRGTKGQVDISGPITLTDPARDDNTIKQVAADAFEALRNAPGPGSAARSRMLSVLHWMKTYGKDFDDTYYDVAPANLGDPFKNPAACYTEFRASGYVCLPPGKVLASCASHLTPELVKEHMNGISQDALGKLLLGYSERIDRGKQHLLRIKRQDSPGAIRCEGIKTLMFDFGTRTKNPKSLYFAWDK